MFCRSASPTPPLLRQVPCGSRRDEIDDTQVHPIRCADRRGDQTADVVRRHLPGRSHDRRSHSSTDEFGLQTAGPRLQHLARAGRRRPEQLRADQNHVTTSTVDHWWNDLRRKVLRTHPRTVGKANGADQHVHRADQVVSGARQSDRWRADRRDPGGRRTLRRHRTEDGPRTPHRCRSGGSPSTPDPRRRPTAPPSQTRRVRTLR